MKNKYDGPVSAIRVGSIKKFNNSTREISEAEEEFLIKNHNFNNNNLKGVKNELNVLRQGEDCNSYDVKNAIEFWSKH